jgi:hypothetical protein
MAALMEFHRQNAACFAHSRLVLGNPWQPAPYGYCGSDGTRGFIALHNATWEDQSIPLCLDERWGLPPARQWQLFRRHPDPAQMTGKTDAFTGEISIALRPFEVILLELVPAAEHPRPNGAFELLPLPQQFSEPSRRLEISCSPLPPGQALRLAIEGDDPSRKPTEIARKSIRVETEIPPNTTEALLAITLEIRQADRLVCRSNPGHYFAGTFTREGQPVPAVPALSRGHPAGWQTWRIALPPSDRPQPFSAVLTGAAEATMELYAQAFFLPGG